MKVKLVCVGKTTKHFLIEGEEEYKKRLKKYISFEKIELRDLKNTKNFSRDQICEKEGEIILEKVLPNDFVILLDERGKTYSSVDFSSYIQQRFNRGGKNITFVIGGPFGFSEKVYQRANDKISLSKLTFSHQMIRLFFIEQLYRSMSILNNEPYHHE